MLNKDTSSWPKISENCLPDPRKKSESLNAVYDIVIPTEDMCLVPESSSVSRRNSRELHARHTACRVNRSRILTEPSDHPRNGPYPHLPTVMSPSKSFSSVLKQDSPGLVNNYHQKMPTVSLPRQSACQKRRDHLGIHLTPETSKTPEEPAQLDCTFRDGSQNFRKRVFLTNLGEDVVPHEEESFSPRTYVYPKISRDADIRASGCKLNLNVVQPMREKSLMYSTNQHGSIYTNYNKKTSKIQRDNLFEKCGNSNPDRESVKARKHPPRRLPLLPGNLSSDEYVFRWLVSGSAPKGESHFPDITL